MEDSKNITLRVSFNQQQNAPLKNNGILKDKPRYQYYWGRIAVLMMIILALLIAIIIGINHYFLGDENLKANEQARIAVTQKINDNPTPLSKSMAETDSPLTQSSTVTPAISVEKPQEASDTALTTNTENTKIATSDSPVGAPTATENTFSPVFTELKTEIFSENIKRFILAPSIQNKEPIGHFNDITFSDNITAVWAFSEVINSKNTVLYYVWSVNGKNIARVRTGVAGDRWRSYSSKLIQSNMHGKWKVSLQDEQGKALAISTFTY